MFKLSTVTLQLLLKGDLSKFLEELLFGTYHALVRSLDRVAKPWSFCYFVKSDSTTDALQPILKFSKQTKEIFAVESVFAFL